MSKENTLKPMPFWLSVLFFGIPGAAMYLGVYYGVPYLDSIGVPLLASWSIGMFLPVALLLPASIIAYRAEGNEMSWIAFKERFRLKPIKGKDWLWIAGVFLIAQSGEFALSFTRKILASIPIFKPPGVLPSLLDPNVDMTGIPSEFFGVPLPGNWWIVLFWLTWLFFNMFGEEFMWRGYILPRQELVYGKWAWLVNGLMWNFLLHASVSWNFVALMPSTLLIPLLTQKMKNTYAGLIVHLAGNALLFVLIIPGILGV